MINDETVVLDKEAMMLKANTSYIPKVSHSLQLNQIFNNRQEVEQKIF